MGRRYTMSVELVRDMINYEKLVGESTSQTMVNGDIVLPERNPEFETILNNYGKVIITGSEVMNDSILVEGKILFEILYSAAKDNAGIYKVSAASNFNHTLQVPGAMPNMSCLVNPEVENLEYEPMGGRKIKVSAVISLKGMVYEKDTVEFISDIKGEDVQILKNSQHIDEFIGENSGQSIVRGKIAIPEEKGEAVSILKSNAHIHKTDVIVQEEKVVVNACALVRVMYEATGGNICYDEQDIAFTHEMNVPGIKPGMKCDVDYKIEDAFEDIKEDENSERKIIEMEMAVGVKVKGYMPREIQIIEDAYSPGERYDFENSNVKSVSIFDSGNDSQTIKERIVVPQDKGQMGDIKHVDAVPILTDVKVVDDKVVMEGLISCSIVYLASGEEAKMVGHSDEIPFKSTIDIPGVKFDMLVRTMADIEHISYDKASSTEVDLKLILGCTAKVYGKNSIDVVKAVEETDISENIKNMPSIVIYTVQNNDTLWKIAKRYNTTAENIVEINDMEEENNIKPGMKILIPKRMVSK